MKPYCGEGGELQLVGVRRNREPAELLQMTLGWGVMRETLVDRALQPCEEYHVAASLSERMDGAWVVAAWVMMGLAERKVLK